MLKPLTLLLLTATAALAEDAAVLAEYSTNSGSLPPEYAWDTSVIIREDGQLTLKHCKGYETEGPACTTRRAKVSAEDVAAIRAAATESGLAEKPAQETDTPLVGGGLTEGRVFLPRSGSSRNPSRPTQAASAQFCKPSPPPSPRVLTASSTRTECWPWAALRARSTA